MNIAYVMSETIVPIKRWGNSLGLRIPASVARKAKLRANQRVSVSVKGGRVVITPCANDALTLADRLALFDPVLHGGEVMAAALADVEQW